MQGASEVLFGLGMLGIGITTIRAGRVLDSRGLRIRGWGFAISGIGLGLDAVDVFLGLPLGGVGLIVLFAGIYTSQVQEPVKLKWYARQPLEKRITGNIAPMPFGWKPED